MTVIRHPNNQGVTLSQWRKTAAGGETSVSGTDDFSAGLAYTAGAEQVFVNGVLLERGVDYTASTGTTVTGLTALVAGDIVTVSSPSAFNVANAIPKATITAKGDLLVGTGASTPTNLGVGADGTTLVANSASATGVAWAGPSVAAGKNAVINGGMDIWQRGTSFVNPSSAYIADRWWAQIGGAITFSQESTTVPLGSKNCMKVVSAGVNTFNVNQPIETLNAIQYAGKTVTVSLQTQTSIVMPLTVALYYSTAVDNAPGGTWTLITPTSGGTFNGSVGSFTQNNTVFAVPSTAKSLMVVFGTNGASSGGFTLYVGQVQLELGSVATTFSRAGGTLQGELAACKYYYNRITAGTTYGYLSLTGGANATTSAVIPISLPIMRVAPTAIDYANAELAEFNGTNKAITSLVIQSVQNNTSIVSLQAGGATGLTVDRPYYLRGANNAAGYVGLSAEL